MFVAMRVAYQLEYIQLKSQMLGLPPGHLGANVL